MLNGERRWIDAALAEIIWRSRWQRLPAWTSMRLAHRRRECKFEIIAKDCPKREVVQSGSESGLLRVVIAAYARSPHYAGLRRSGQIDNGN